MYIIIGRMDVTKRECLWFVVDRFSKGMDCDIFAQDLIGLIEYSYHQGIPSFLKGQL
jgi:hypothetical protein